MPKQQTLADYYADKMPLVVPSSPRSEGHFAVWRLEDFATNEELVSGYSRKDFYKIVLTLTGNATYHYADQHQVLAAGQAALVFTNTQVPYRWEVDDMPCRGYCCVFTEDFLPAHTHLRPADWSVFTPGGQSFFRLTPAQVQAFSQHFEKMLTEQESTYPYKYELLYHQMMECVHGALKLAPAPEVTGAAASSRLAAEFLALLARQFPIVTPERPLALHSAQAFADRLAVHVNSLNRALKAATGKTTTQLLAERLVQEARALLRHTDWPISLIAHCLGFEEATHFTAFFRRHTRSTPSALRQGGAVPV
jgi:AraC family transcriptional regulator, transcriptional activator of pobA